MVRPPGYACHTAPSIGQPEYSSGKKQVGVTVGDGFWRDLEWWSDHMSNRNSISLVTKVAGEAAITGTDASDWGTGQAVFIDGGLEESRLQFTSAEKRRPINWRELLGIVRVFEWYGERLSGMTVLVETDNMAAKGAVCKMSSSSADMAELLRRLLDAAHEHNITVKCIHTPGEKLFRPDQSSRGDPIHRGAASEADNGRVQGSEHEGRRLLRIHRRRTAACNRNQQQSAEINRNQHAGQERRRGFSGGHLGAPHLLDCRLDSQDDLLKDGRRDGGHRGGVGA